MPPPFEVFTGSSNVFIGGSRAARIGDITKHCNPTSMGPLSIAMGAAGAAIGAVGAVGQASAGNTGAAVAQAAQAAAEAAKMALQLLCGKDPGLPPGMGALLGPPVPNVLIGGFPCPPIGDFAVAGLMKALKKLARVTATDQSGRTGKVEDDVMVCAARTDAGPCSGGDPDAGARDADVPPVEDITIWNARGGVCGCRAARVPPRPRWLLFVVELLWV